MKLYFPVESTKTTNLITNRPCKLDTDTVEEFKRDDMIVLDSDALLESIEFEMDNDTVDEAFVNKLLKILGENEDFQRIIVKKGLDLATKCTEDPERALFVAAKKMWASLDRY